MAVMEYLGILDEVKHECVSAQRNGFDDCRMYSSACDRCDSYVRKPDTKDANTDLERFITYNSAHYLSVSFRRFFWLVITCIVKRLTGKQQLDGDKIWLRWQVLPSRPPSVSSSVVGTTCSDIYQTETNVI